MKKTITLKWNQTTFATMKDLDSTNFYLFMRFGKIIYIGMTGVTSKQSVQDEINSKKASMFEGNVKGVSVWLGCKINKNDDTNAIQSLNDGIVRDVENLLICKIKPCKNVQCVNKYDGRDLLIVNNGCQKLPKKIDSSEFKK